MNAREVKTLPRFIMVFGRKVKIRYVTAAIPIEDGRSARGLYFHRDKEIVVSTEGAADEVWETIIHELGHAIMDASGMFQTSLSADMHELIVEQFSKVIHSNFRFRKGRKAA